LGSFKEEHFINGFSRISGIQHPNSVPIQGFCFKELKRVLVNQYMPNGSLGWNFGGDLEFENLKKSCSESGHGALKLGHHLNDPEMPLKPVFISVQYLRETKSELDSPKEMLLPETMERSS
ncbi:hypothetical protein Goarm_002606, partial [Gossypium armourianum]|nr:hypothetical protein [Gossypium armourianum]